MKTAVDESYRLLAARHLRLQVSALSEQVEGARKGEDIECVHQARVASRRLRAVLRMFRDCFPARRSKKRAERTARMRLVSADLSPNLMFIRFE